MTEREDYADDDDDPPPSLVEALFVVGLVAFVAGCLAAGRYFRP